MSETALTKPATALSVVRHVDEATGLERVEALIDIRPYLYNPGGETGSKTRAITSAGYALINSIKGVSFGAPQILERTPDTLVVALSGEYYNAAGTLVRDVDMVEMNYQVFYLRMRANWCEKKWNKEENRYEIIRQAKIEITYDESGNPVQRVVLPEEAEREIFSKILWLRQNGMRVLLTVLKNRLIKQATGIKSVPAPATPNEPVVVSVVGYRPIAGSAAAAVTNLYGPQPEPPAPGEIDTVITELTQEDDPQAEILDAAEAVQQSEQTAGLDLQSPERPAQTEQSSPAQDKPPQAKPSQTKPPQDKPPATGPICADCGVRVTSEAVQKYSKQHYKVVLCMKCQHKRKGAAQ